MNKLARFRIGSSGLDGYLTAVAAVAVTLGIGVALQPFLEGRPLLILFVPALLAASMLGGFGPGLFAVVLGLAGSVVVDPVPAWSVAVGSPARVIADRRGGDTLGRSSDRSGE